MVLWYKHLCIPPASLSYARGQHGLNGARIMLSMRIADPLSGRRAGSWCGKAKMNHELFLGLEGGRETVGWGIRESSTWPLAANGGEQCMTIYVCVSFLRAIVVVLVVSVIILIHFVVECLPIFYRGLMCMCCVCVCTHTHTHCMRGTQMWAQVSGRDTWRAQNKSRCIVVMVYTSTMQCTKYTFIYICWATGRNLDWLPFCFLLTCFSFHKKEKKKMWAKSPISQIKNRFERIAPQ